MAPQLHPVLSSFIIIMLEKYLPVVHEATVIPDLDDCHYLTLNCYMTLTLKLTLTLNVSLTFASVISCLQAL